jgi:hypothetical protein
MLREELDAERAGDAAGDLALEREDVFDLALVVLRPEVSFIWGPPSVRGGLG